MAHLIDQIKIDTTSYDYEVNEHSDYKDGFFYFENSELTVKIGFTSDEYGNVDSLGVSNAVDSYGEPTYFSICGEDEYRAIVDQIEPMLWGESQAVETEHGMRNSDFQYGYSA